MEAGSKRIAAKTKWILPAMALRQHNLGTAARICVPEIIGYTN